MRFLKSLFEVSSVDISIIAKFTVKKSTTDADYILSAWTNKDEEFWIYKGTEQDCKDLLVNGGLKRYIFELI